MQRSPHDKRMVTTRSITKGDHLARAWRETKAERRWKSEVASNSTQDPFFVDLDGSRSWVVAENRFHVLSEDMAPTDCARLVQNRRKVQKIVKLLEVDQFLKPSQTVPSTVPCGSLRKAVRSMFAPELTLAQELSIKTSAKAEVQPCTTCENLQGEKLETWEKARFQPVAVDAQHLERFAASLRENIPRGWERFRSAYVPNGHASLGRSRCRGGNWNEDSFSEECEVQLVHSSGKPRVVTLYSSHNVQTLTPLHNSLYNCLRKRGWLLVGSPTNESLRQVSDGTLGPEWLSFDYESATDNIKTAYVRRAVDILIEQAVSLSTDEVRCLRVLSDLKIGQGHATSGQPMGSPMSFPLLCLINKTVVDLALTKMLERKEIRVKEWTRHRCRINGDDLLTKSTSGGDLVAAISSEGAEVGLRVQREKTMRSERDAEINSTAFRDGCLVKKTNVAALWMRSEVEDVLGFAEDSCATDRGFRQVAEGNHNRLAKAVKKVHRNLPGRLREVVCRSPKLKAALRARPSTKVPNATNLFPVVPRPHGYDLTAKEEVDIVTSEVARIRERGLWLGLRPESARISALRKAVSVIPDRVRSRRDKIMRLLRCKNQRQEDRTLSVLARHWEYKRKERLVEEEGYSEELCPPSDFSQIQCFVDCIKAWKQMRASGPKPTSPSGGDPFQQCEGLVRLTDE